MWARVGLPKPDRLVASLRYQRTLAEVYAYSAVHHSAEEVRAERLRKPARLRLLLHLLGDPDRNFPCILVAGTKGKGSTTTMIAGMLHAAGLRVGRYTQPHLVSWRERTWVNNRYLSVDQTVASFPDIRLAAETLHRERPDLGRLTTFEVGTALSLARFSDAQVDVAIVEVGVGGRHDATNALDPSVSVITPISFDHVDVIGPEITDIAREKAGVMRSDRPVIIGRQPAEAVPVLRAEAASLHALAVWVGADWCWDRSESEVREASLLNVRGPHWSLRDIELPLLGDFQRENATAAVAAVAASGFVPADELPGAVRRGLRQLRWPGRAHVLQERPVLIFDGAHNAESAHQLRSTIQASYGNRGIRWIIGLSRGKDVPGFLEAISQRAMEIVVTQASHERSIPAPTLAGMAREAVAAAGTPIEVTTIADPCRALHRALSTASPDEVVCVTGSFFLLGDLYSDYRLG